MSISHLLTSQGSASASSDARPPALSRSEEDDSDDSGVIKDVSKRKGDAKKLEEKDKEQEISVNIDTVDSSDEEAEEDAEDRSRKKDKPPKKWNYKDHDAKLKKSPLSPTSPPGIMFSVGDLVWGRTMGSSYHPCVVSQDPHFRFHTKIVKSEPGSCVETSPGSGREGVGERQYHVQYLGDNKRVWLPSKQIIPYKGIAHYEQMAIQDVKNINKIYKPKTEALKTAWREAVLLAQQLEQLTAQERISRCDMARLRERGGKALQKKMEFESKRRSSESDDSGKGRRSSESSDMKSPERFKSPTSPRKPVDKEKEGEERKKSAQYRRREEMEYKMTKGMGQEKKKRKMSDDEKKPEGSKSLPLNILEVATPTFNRSFKIKGKVKDEISESKTDVLKKGVDGKKAVNDSSANGDAKTPLSRGISGQDNGNRQDVSNGGSVDGEREGAGEGKEGNGKGGGEEEKSNLKFGTVTANESLVEGSLVWAKIRGYPYWPSVVTRDPDDGEFVKVPDSQYKTQRKYHVLFLEYNNQRAWLPSTSLNQYQGRQQFQAEAAKAGPNRKKDFIPGKRYQAQFERAVDFSESLVSLSNEERLEAVLLKYGWVMVSEPGSGEERGGQKQQKKRKTVSQSNRDTETEVEVNKSTDSETDYQSNMASPAMARPSSADRRSSAEAESRLDPGVDTLEGDTSNTTQRVGSVLGGGGKKKRESSLIAAIAMNGDSSSDDSGPDSGGESKSKKVKKRPPISSEKAIATPTPAKPKASPIPRPKVQTVSTPGSPLATQPPPPPPKTGEPDEFPRMGDLVWGRMSGFPFWPSFVTMSPTGQYRREGPSGKASYHVQFFNWNDESGWVNAVIEFDGLDSFKKIAAKKKTDKSYNPSKGAMMSKWERAAREAEETMGLTRLERLEQYLVSYGGGQPTRPPKPAPVKTPKPVAAPKPKKPPTPASVPPVKRTPGPASKTGVKRASPGGAGAPSGQLPAGWRIRNRVEGGQTYISPDGREFQDKTAALRYIASTAGQGQAVKYVEDSSLPQGWRCQKIQNSIYYFSPRGERFETRDAVADRLEEEGATVEVVTRVRRGGKKKRVGPKSFLRRLGMECASDDSARESSTSEDEDPETILRLPNGLKFRKGGQMDEFLDLDKLFDPSNGGIIEMVQLPDIFLEHPTVSVTESDNEMVISDVDTGEFIAKKIIYD